MGINDDVLAVHRQMADDLLAVGPEAPGGVPEWTAGDLAAHLLSQTGGARFVLAGARLALARGIRPPRRSAVATNANAIRMYGRRDFTRAIDAVRAGPPFPLLRGELAPVALFEIWVHNDDLRRANKLGAGLEPESLAAVVDFLARYQRAPLNGAPLERSVPDADLVRWLTGRPSPLAPHDPPLTI